MRKSETSETFLFDEPLGGGLRYTEAPARSRFGEPILECRLWKEGEEQPVSLLLLYPLRQRFGAAVVETEGFAGVATPPEQRGRGYARRLLERSLERLRDRVSVAFLFGVEMLYDRFGFVTCLDEGSLTLWVHRTESLAFDSQPRLRPISPGELPLIIDLFNRAHGERPWSIARDRTRWNRIPNHETWRPGSRVYALHRAERLSRSVATGAGENHRPADLERRGDRPPAPPLGEGSRRVEAYAVFRDTNFGEPRRRFVVQEMCAADLGAARRMLAAVGRSALREHVDAFMVYEPEDSLIGTAAREIGCRVTRRTQRSGGGMGIILDRRRLLDSLEGELDRRSCAARPVSPPAQAESPAAESPAAESPAAESPAAESRVAGSPVAGSRTTRAYQMLRAGELVPDDRDLLRLLLGYWSVRDLDAHGAAIPAEARAVLEAWFPGGGTGALALPYSHLLDRY